MQTPAQTPAGRPQIVTLTMNPALDITTSVHAVRPTDKLRCAATRYDPGGGGINVAHIAHELGGSVLAVFPAGGTTGGLIARLLADEGVPFWQVPIAAATRESFTVNESSTGRQYRFVLPGPQLTLREQAHCLEQLRMAAKSAEFVVASGSLPPGVTTDFYQRVACGTSPPGCSFSRRACESCGNASGGPWKPRPNSSPPHMNSSIAGAPKRCWCPWDRRARCS
jgi:6-phosphofructokinase 2